MKALLERIRREGRILPGGILKVDSFLNHQLDPQLTLELGREFRERFAQAGVTSVDRIVTAEASGIAPALAAAAAFAAPLVYARKRRPLTMSQDVLESYAPSATKGGVTPLLISPEYLPRGDRVLLVDDFLASGRTVMALAELIARAGAQLVGAGFVIEKSFQGGREVLGPLEVPIISLAVVTNLSAGTIELAD